MKRWMIGGGAIALLTSNPALGQPVSIWRSQPQYQPQYQFQHQPQYQHRFGYQSQYQHQYQYQYQPPSRYQPQYQPQAPVIPVNPGGATIMIYRNSPYSNRSSYTTTPYRQAVPVYPVAPIYVYPTPIRSNFREISVPVRFVKRSLRESRFSQPYQLQTISPAPYPYGAQVYPIYDSPTRR